MQKSVKTAISLPWEDFKIIESLRKKNHQSRSEIIREAIHVWLKVNKTKVLEGFYKQGYHQFPEKAPELEAFFKIGLASWHEKDDWS